MKNLAAAPEVIDMTNVVVEAMQKFGFYEEGDGQVVSALLTHAEAGSVVTIAVEDDEMVFSISVPEEELPELEKEIEAAADHGYRSSVQRNGDQSPTFSVYRKRPVKIEQSKTIMADALNRASVKAQTTAEKINELKRQVDEKTHRVDELDRENELLRSLNQRKDEALETLQKEFQKELEAFSEFKTQHKKTNYGNYAMVGALGVGIGLGLAKLIGLKKD